MDNSNTCQACAYWVPEASSPSTWKTGTCHYWPPVRSNEVLFTTTEQVENPEILDLKNSLSTAESLQIQLELQSTQVFANYPVRMTYEEMEKARSDVGKGLSDIADLKRRLEQERSDNPFVLKEVSHIHKSGAWPVTASDEWCGQWNS